MRKLLLFCALGAFTLTYGMGSQVFMDARGALEAAIKQQAGVNEAYQGVMKLLPDENLSDDQQIEVNALLEQALAQISPRLEVPPPVSPEVELKPEEEVSFDERAAVGTVKILEHKLDDLVQALGGRHFDLAKEIFDSMLEKVYVAQDLLSTYGQLVSAAEQIQTAKALMNKYREKMAIKIQEWWRSEEVQAKLAKIKEAAEEAKAVVEAKVAEPSFNATVFVKKLPRNMRQALASHKHRKHSEMIRAAKKSLGKKAAGLTDDQIVAIVKKSW